MKNKFDYFKAGNNKILYSDVKSYEYNTDVNGNPKYKVILKDGSRYKIIGSQAYAFDFTRIRY